MPDPTTTVDLDSAATTERLESAPRYIRRTACHEGDRPRQIAATPHCLKTAVAARAITHHSQHGSRHALVAAAVSPAGRITRHRFLIEPGDLRADYEGLPMTPHTPSKHTLSNLLSIADTDDVAHDLWSAVRYTGVNARPPATYPQTDVEWSDLGTLVQDALKRVARDAITLLRSVFLTSPDQLRAAHGDDALAADLATTADRRDDPGGTAFYEAAIRVALNRAALNAKRREQRSA